MKRKVVFITAACFVVAAVIFSGRDLKDENVSHETSFLLKIYEESKIKKIKKEIARKVYSKDFNNLIKGFSLPKLEAINYLVGRESLRDSLNSKNRTAELLNINSPDIDSNDAENILKVSRELVDLSKISPELKEYLKGEYKGFDFVSFSERGDKILSFIRNKELIGTQLPKNMTVFIEQLPPAKAESIMEILDGEVIPQKIDITTNDFTKLSISYEKMKEVYELCGKLYRIGKIEPKFLDEANKLYLNLDYTRIARYGEFYLQDKKSLDSLEKKTREKDYSFEFPMIVRNPFGRVSDMAYLYYPGSDEESVKVTIKGRGGEPDISYHQNSEKFIKIYGLYLNGKSTQIVLDNGKKVTEIEIASEKVPDEMPVVEIKKSSEERGNGLYYMTYTYGNKIFGVAIDNFGKIRYLFDPLENQNIDDGKLNWGLLFNRDRFTLFNDEIVFSFGLNGEIKNSWSRAKYENEIGKLVLKKVGTYNATTELIEDNRKSLTTVEFREGDYPLGQLIETDLIDKKKVFEADIYFDKNSIKANRIMAGNIMEIFN